MIRRAFQLGFSENVKNAPKFAHKMCETVKYSLIFCEKVGTAFVNNSKSSRKVNFAAAFVAACKESISQQGNCGKSLLTGR